MGSSLVQDPGPCSPSPGSWAWFSVYTPINSLLFQEIQLINKTDGSATTHYANEGSRGCGRGINLTDVLTYSLNININDSSIEIRNKTDNLN